MFTLTVAVAVDPPAVERRKRIDEFRNRVAVERHLRSPEPNSVRSPLRYRPAPRRIRSRTPRSGRQPPIGSRTGIVFAERRWDLGRVDGKDQLFHRFGFDSSLRPPNGQTGWGNWTVGCFGAPGCGYEGGPTVRTGGSAMKVPRAPGSKLARFNGSVLAHGIQHTHDEVSRRT